MVSQSGRMQRHAVHVDAMHVWFTVLRAQPAVSLSLPAFAVHAPPWHVCVVIDRVRVPPFEQAAA